MRSFGFLNFSSWPSRVFTYVVCTLIAVCSIIGLLPRLGLERDNRNVAVIVDYRDIIPLAEEDGISNVEALKFLQEKGVAGLMVNEFISADVEYAKIGRAHV